MNRRIESQKGLLHHLTACGCQNGRKSLTLFLAALRIAAVLNRFAGEFLDSKVVLKDFREACHEKKVWPYIVPSLALGFHEPGQQEPRIENQLESERENQMTQEMHVLF